MYKRLKEQNSSYLKRTDWKYDNRRYINTEFMHKWHLIGDKRDRMLTLEPRRFMNKECLRARL